MIRIVAESRGSQTIVSIAGRLEKEHLAELEKHCANQLSTTVLDLSELQTTDEQAIEWLHDYLKQGGRVASASPYIDLLLHPAKRGS